MIERLKRIILTGLSLFIFTSFLSLNAQWAITYGGSGWEDAICFQQTSDGGYIVGGNTRSFGAKTFDVWILKLSSDGEIEWQKTYGGSNQEKTSFIQQTNDGGYIVLGQISAIDAEDIWVLKLASDGEIEWQKTYGYSSWETDRSIRQTNDGGYIVAYEIAIYGAGGPDIRILKLTSDGEIEWRKIYGGDKSDSASFIQQRGDGGYIVLGQTESFGAGGDDIWILKISSDGEIEWQRTYGGDDSDYAHSFQQTNDGGYIVGGNTRSFAAENGDIWILKISSDGEIEWQRTYGGSDSDSASFIQQTDDGGYIVLGQTSSFGAGGEDIWVLKLTSDGEIEWQKTYGGSSRGKASFIQQTDDGGYIVLGQTSSFDDGGEDIWVLKLTSDGKIEWQKTYGGDYSTDIAHTIQQTNDGGYIVAGDTNSWGADREIWVLKLLPNGDINPRCAFIKRTNAEVLDTDIMPEETDITPKDLDMTPEDTHEGTKDTDITPQDSNANVYKLCVSDICTLTLSTSGEGTIIPESGSYTYDIGTEVTLRATPAGMYYFNMWSGNVQSGINPITLTMDGSKSIQAIFIIAGGWGDGGGDMG